MLKKIFITTAILFSTNALAEIQSINEGSTGISSIRGEVISVIPLCPENVTCITDGTVVTIRYHLNGCLDTFVDGGVAATEEGNKLHVYASGLNIHNKQSRVAFCAAMPTATKTYTFIMKFGAVELANLGVN